MNEGAGMEHSQSSEATPAKPVRLRQARESLGMPIDSLAAALKVPVRKLEALEEGRYDELPDLTFARALASSACRTLKIDPAPILAEIPAGNLPDLGDSPQTINAPFKAPEDGPNLSLGGLLSKPVVLGVLVLLVATVGLLFVPSVSELKWAEWSQSLGSIGSSANGEGSVSEAVMPADTVTEESLTTTPIAPSLQSSTEMSAPAAGSQPQTALGNAGDSIDSNETVSTETVAPAEESASSDAAAGDSNVDAQTAVGAALLQISAVGETWIEVVNGAGAVVVQRVFKKGDVMTFSSSPPYSVVIGNANAAEVQVRGNPFDTSRFARNRVARFKVP